MTDTGGAPLGMRRVLAGDVGGTKILLQLAEIAPEAGYYRVLREGRYESAAYDALEPAVSHFMGGEEADAACFGVAGPVIAEEGYQHARLTNLPWRLHSLELAQGLGISTVRLINDFQATGYGIEMLGDRDFVTLQAAPAAPHGPRLVIGAGTGLGVAFLFRCGERYQVHPTEAGHIDFGPIDEEQQALASYFRSLYGRVSCERILSGNGLDATYRFLLSQRGATPATDSILSAPDTAAAISAAAIDEGDPIASEALDIFVKVYGSVAGNFALASLATGGVYIAGGIAPKILPALQAEGVFVREFNAKGRMEPLTRSMPIHVVTNPGVGLLGAALVAGRL